MVGRSRLSFLSWNLSMLERSAEAPPGWQLHDTEAVIRDTVLDLGPDLLLYQELPGMVPYVETHDMVRANPRSHSGNLATLARAELMTTSPVVATVPGCALLTTLTGPGATEPSLTVANVHLAPGPGASATAARLGQLAAVVEASPTEALIIIGDTNTRVAELEAITEAGFDAVAPPHPTWDSRRNRYRSDGPRFSAYFTRWFASPPVQVVDVTVHRAGIERDGYRFHLSDHFALSGTIVV